MASKRVKQLARRLFDEFGITVCSDDFRRTYAGKHMKAGGAFHWEFIGGIQKRTVGGCDPIAKCVRKDVRLKVRPDRFREIEVYAYAPDDVGYND